MQPILKEWELCFTFFRAEDLRKVFGILLYRMFVYAPSFIHSFSSVSTNGYLILLNFVADIFSLWPLEALFSWLLCPFDIPQSHGFFSPKTFLLSILQDTPRLILHIFCPSHFSKEVPFIGVWDYKPEFGP